jgi:hypothetical protein
MGETYQSYTGREDVFGLGYPLDGELGSAHDEMVKTVSLGRIMGAMLGALGVGIYRGGLATIVEGSLRLTEIGWTVDDTYVPGAVIEDSLGAVPVYKALTVLAASAFPTGVSYVHLQVTATAREDLSCGYYVDTAQEPAPDALRVCKVTKAAGALTAVDNSVQTPPALAARLPWGLLITAIGEEETLAEVVEAIEARLTALEGAEPGGTGEGGTPNWGELLNEFAGVAKTIRQAAAEEAETVAEAAVAAHLTAEHGAAAGEDGETVAAGDQWDIVAENQIRLALEALHYLPDSGRTARDMVLCSDDHYGHLVGDVNFVDDANSTF